MTFIAMAVNTAGNIHARSDLVAYEEWCETKRPREANKVYIVQGEILIGISGGWIPGAAKQVHQIYDLDLTMPPEKFLQDFVSGIRGCNIEAIIGLMREKSEIFVYHGQELSSRGRYGMIGACDEMMKKDLEQGNGSVDKRLDDAHARSAALTAASECPVKGYFASVLYRKNLKYEIAASIYP